MSFRYVVNSTQIIPVCVQTQLVFIYYRGADKSLARPGRKQARKHVRDARDFNNIETRAVIKVSPPLQGKTPEEIHAILIERLASFRPGRAKDLSASLYIELHVSIYVRSSSGLQLS